LLELWGIFLFGLVIDVEAQGEVTRGKTIASTYWPASLLYNSRTCLPNPAEGNMEGVEPVEAMPWEMATSGLNSQT
jgi:hypothetical protein